MNAKFVPSALLVALSAALFGCNNNQNTEAPASEAAPAEPATTASADVPASELADVQEITINNGAEPQSLDPHKVSGVPESNILRQMLVGLVSTDAEGKTIPGMATEWSSPDNKVWTFKLRDAKWSNGDPVTAQDFVYSFRRLTNPETQSPYQTYLVDTKVVNAKEISEGTAAPDSLGVKAIDDKTLEITLAEPVPYFPDTLFHTSVKPVHQKTVEAHGDKWTSPANFVGNGPYKLTEWVVNERIVMDRNPEYFDNDKTTINKVTLLAVGDGPTAINRYKSGEMDVTDTIPSELFDSLKAEIPNEVKVNPSLCTYYYEFNHTKKPFDDVRVRKALTLTIDRETITDKVLRQGQTPAYQYTPTTIAGNVKYEPEWKSWDKAKRIEEAKKLLAEAGYSEGNPLKFELLYNTSESHKKLATAVDSFWKEAFGNVVQPTMVNQEWKTYLETRQNQKHEVSRGGWCADFNEASTFLNTFKSDNSSNYGKYNNPEFDKLILATLAADVTSEKRTELYNQAEALLDKDSATAFVYHYVNPRLIKPYVLGWSSTDPQNQWHVKDLKIAKH